MLLRILAFHNSDHSPFTNRHVTLLTQSLFEQQKGVLFVQRFIIPEIDRALNFHIGFDSIVKSASSHR